MHSHEVKTFEKAAIARILILVVMEDALALTTPVWNIEGLTGVLILVVMEDALAQDPKNRKGQRFRCLNPCCNGRCTRTSSSNMRNAGETCVLILVVMEDALAL